MSLEVSIYNIYEMNHNDDIYTVIQFQFDTLSSVNIFSSTYFADEYLVSNLKSIHDNESLYIITPNTMSIRKNNLNHIQLN